MGTLEKKIHRVMMMGGALPPHPGNIRNPFRGKPLYLNNTAEWNVFLDPKAADEVFHSGLHVDLVTLNACEFFRLGPFFHPNDYARLVSGWWSTFTGWDLNPPGFNEAFQRLRACASPPPGLSLAQHIHTHRPRFSVFAAQKRKKSKKVMHRSGFLHSFLSFLFTSLLYWHFRVDRLASG